MIDTTDLPSYYPGYDEYCEPKIYEEEEYDNSDELYEEMTLRREFEKMKRNIIDLANTDLTFDEIMQLENYAWQGNLLIPEEKIGG